MTPRRAGSLLMAIASGVGLVIAGAGYLSPDSGITGTPGALLVVGSSLALLIAALLLPVLAARGDWLHGLFIVLCVLGLLGTGIAAWFLELPLLVAAMVVAAVGLAMHLMRAVSPVVETTR
jgi:hypothetical protein